MRGSWALGFMVGPLAAIALLALPTPGLVLSVLVALLLLRARGLPAVAGMFFGTGVFGLAVLAQANARCETFYSGCLAPNVTIPVVIAAVLLIGGAALTLALFVKARGRRLTA